MGSDSTALSQDSSQLLGAQTALAAAQAHVTQQKSLITSLQTCLVGVERALNELAVGKLVQRHCRAELRFDELHGRGGFQWLTPRGGGAGFGSRP